MMKMETGISSFWKFPRFRTSGFQTFTVLKKLCCIQFHTLRPVTHVFEEFVLHFVFYYFIVFANKVII